MEGNETMEECMHECKYSLDLSGSGFRFAIAQRV